MHARMNTRMNTDARTVKRTIHIQMHTRMNIRMHASFAYRCTHGWTYTNNIRIRLHARMNIRMHTRLKIRANHSHKKVVFDLIIIFNINQGKRYNENLVYLESFDKSVNNNPRARSIDIIAVLMRRAGEGD